MDEVNYLYAGGSDPHYSVDKLSANDADYLYCSETECGRVFSKTGENYKVVSSSTVLGAMNNGSALNIKSYYLSEIVNYFLDILYVSVEEHTARSILSNNYPNPFNDYTTIEFTTLESEKVQVEIFDLRGQMVKKLIDKKLSPGTYSTTWDGTNENGNLVNNGFYFYTLTIGDVTLSEKMILLR